MDPEDGTAIIRVTPIVVMDIALSKRVHDFPRKSFHMSAVVCLI